jgi:hypothetical protein
MQMTRLAIAVVPLLAFAGAAFAATPPAAPAPRTGHPHHLNTPAARRMTHALNLLEAGGYGAFHDFRSDGKNFAASVTQQGRAFTVVIDPDSGQLTRQS